jgi:hypothetical protein
MTAMMISIIWPTYQRCRGNVIVVVTGDHLVVKSSKVGGDDATCDP